ncbi:Phosphorelay intermediate protein [Coniothyrium glycines]
MDSLTPAEASLFDPSIIDMRTFSQILEMDDGEVRDFSREIVSDFIHSFTFWNKSIDEAIHNDSLKSLKALGSEFGGSARTLGLVKISDTANKIENLASKKDEFGQKPLEDEDEIMRRIVDQVERIKVHHEEAEAMFRRFYPIEQ